MIREVKVRSKSVNRKVMARLAADYECLLSQCRELSHGYYCGAKDYEDMFMDCFLTVSSDHCAISMSSAALHDYFLYRFKMILFQNLMDHRQEMGYNNSYCNANNQETAQEAE